MKKIFSLVLSVIMTMFIFTACQKDDVTEIDSTTTKTTTTEKIDETSSETTVTDKSEAQTTESNSIDETEVTTEKTTVAEKPEETTIVVANGILSSFESKDINGKKVDSSVFKGKKLTMINIWATFCGPCINEMPDLGKINREYADKGFQIIGIPVDVVDFYGNLDEYQLSLAKEIIGETGADYIHILPSDSLNSAKLDQVSAVPETIFVDENGCQVGQSYIGSRSEEQWLSIIDGLMENMQ